MMVKLVRHTPEPERTVAMSARLCYSPIGAAQLEEKISSASALLLTEYRGLTVAQMTELRKNLAGTATYSVTKNTLARMNSRLRNMGRGMLPLPLLSKVYPAF